MRKNSIIDMIDIEHIHFLSYYVSLELSRKVK